MKPIEHRVVRIGLRMAGLFTIVGLAIGLTGCLGIVLPTPPANTGYARTNVTDQVMGDFALGETTKEDVFMVLGEPDAVSMDEQTLAYRSEKIVAVWMVGVAGNGAGAATGGGINRERFYLFDFDSQDFLSNVSTKGSWSGDVGFDEATVSPARLDDDNTNRVPVCLRGQKIIKICSNTFWFANADGFATTDNVYLTGKNGRFIITESNLVFLARSTFADEDPMLIVPLSMITEVRLDRFGMLERLIIRTDAGQCNSFEIHKTNGRLQDKPAMRAMSAVIAAGIHRPSDLNR